MMSQSMIRLFVFFFADVLKLYLNKRQNKTYKTDTPPFSVSRGAPHSVLLLLKYSSENNELATDWEILSECVTYNIYIYIFFK